MARKRYTPETIIRELREAGELRNWLEHMGAKTACLMPGSPWEKGYCESFSREGLSCKLCAKIFVRTELAGAPGARIAPAREQRDVYVRRPVHPFVHWPASRTSRGEEDAPRQGQEA